MSRQASIQHSRNSGARAYRTDLRVRGHFPDDEAALKLLFLVLREVSKDWKIVVHEWNAARIQFTAMFGERFVAD